MVSQKNVITNLNRAHVFNLLSENEPLTISELVKKSDLSKLTIKKYIKQLIKENLIKEGENKKIGNGRPALLYEVKWQGKISLSIYFDLPFISIASIDLKGKIIAKEKFLINDDNNDNNEKLNKIHLNLKNFIKKEKLIKKNILGIGVVIPGFFDPKTGISISIPRINGWENVSIKSYLENKFNLPVKLINDTNSMALAEQEFGSVIKHDNFAFVFAGDGISAGIIHNGDLYESEFGNSGLLGHNSINKDGPECYCGSTGCIEQYASVKAITKENLAYSNLDDYNKVCNLVRKYNNGEEIESIKKAISFFGIGLANLLNLLGIREIVLGGYLTYGGERVLNDLYSIIQNRTHNIISSNVNLQYSTLKNPGHSGGGVYFIRSITQPIDVTNSYNNKKE